MKLNEFRSKNSYQRFLSWVGENPTKLGLILGGGVVFFILLLGTNYFLKSREGSRAQERVAALDQAVNALEDGQYDDCISLYQKVYQLSDHQPFFRVQALHQMGVCARGKLDYQKSHEFFDRAAKEPGNIQPIYSEYEALRSLKMAGDVRATDKFKVLLAKPNIPMDLKNMIEEELLWQHLVSKK